MSGAGDLVAGPTAQPRATVQHPTDVVPITVPPAIVAEALAAPGRAAIVGPRRRVRAAAIVIVVGVYLLYGRIRVAIGRSPLVDGQPVAPFDHAVDVMRLQRWLGIGFERTWQQFAVGQRWLIEIANTYYTRAHQPVALGLICAVLLRAPWAKATQWVGAMLLQLPVALVLFATYPLMPPRLLDAGAPWGGAALQGRRGGSPTGFLDTLVEFPGHWTPAPVAVGGYTNQFAAMPSLHCGFAIWVGIVWWQFAKGKWWRVIGPLHAALTFWVVVVTGNHFVLDAVAGWTVAIAGLLATRAIGQVVAQRKAAKPAPEGGFASIAAG